MKLNVNQAHDHEGLGSSHLAERAPASSCHARILPGLALLPLNVTRHNTKEIYELGARPSFFPPYRPIDPTNPTSGKCIGHDSFLAIHEVKATMKYDCMSVIHGQVAAKEDICSTNFCPPAGVVCAADAESAGSASTATPCPDKGTPLEWEPISVSSACELEANMPSRELRRLKEETPQAQVKKHFLHEAGLECCKKRCEAACWCVAVDYYEDSGWCNLFEQACTKPMLQKDGGSSHKLMARL